MSPPRDLADVWTWFADTSCRDYSPLYDKVCRAVAASEPVLDLVRQAPAEAHLPNVLLAAVHYLLLDGAEHPLAAVYHAESDADPGPLFVDFCLSHAEAILELMATHHTNTNEVGRSAVLGLALTDVAARLGDPLGLVDVGCSAGLNLLCDRYLLDYGPAGSTGPADAAVRLGCEVVDGPAPVAPSLPPIEARVGLDRDPVDVHDEDQARWLLACIWPDTGRLPRTRLALEQARLADIPIVKGDAVDDLPAVVRGLPPSCVPVVVTTWALAYLSKERRVEFGEVLRELGRERPVAWVSGEGPGVVDLFAGVESITDAAGMVASVLGLAVVAGGDVEPTLLGFVHPHGNWVDWRA